MAATLVLDCLDHLQACTGLWRSCGSLGIETDVRISGGSDA